MNYILIIGFIVFIFSVVIFLFPKHFILMMGQRNTHDLDSIPLSYIRIVYFVSGLFLILSLIVIFYETSVIDIPLPDIPFLEEWFNV